MKIEERYLEIRSALLAGGLPDNHCLTETSLALVSLEGPWCKPECDPTVEATEKKSHHK